MERKIGEIFEYNSEWYQCVEGRCRDCYFSEKRYLCKQFITKNFCTSDIIFKKLEKVGNPYTYNTNGDKGMVKMQEYKLYDINFCKECDSLMLVSSYNPKRISIEIKQTREDMEEKKVRLKKEDIDFLYNKFIEIIEECVVKGYNIDNVQHEFGKLFLMIKDSDTKLNLKPFDLKAAKLGKPVCTRDGRKARIICFDANGGRPIVALVTECDNEEEIPYKYHCNGYYNCTFIPSDNDLMMFPEKKEGWILLRKDGYTFDNEEVAKKNCTDEQFVAKVEWEE